MPLVLMLARLTRLLLHAPPGVALFSVVVLPAHTLSVPLIVLGSGFTTTVAVRIQPVGRV